MRGFCFPPHREGAFGILYSMQFAHPDENVRALELKEKMRVADFGAGSGYYAIAIGRAVGPDGRVYAIDVQKDLLSRIKSKGQSEGVRNIETIWADLDTMGGTKLADNSMDAVVIANVLFQSEHKENMLREARRILKPGHFIMLIDWNDAERPMGPHRSQLVSEGTAKKLLESGGFDFWRAFFAGAHHYGLIYRKK